MNWANYWAKQGKRVSIMMNQPAYTAWLAEKNLSPCTIRLYLAILAKFQAQSHTLDTESLQTYFRTNLTNYDPASLKTQKYALNSYAKFKQLTVEWEKISRIIPSSQRKCFDTLNEAELALLKQTRIEKNESLWKRNNLMLDFLFYSGLRVSELINIKHTDWQGKQLKVHGKGNKVRFILLPDFLISHFQPASPAYLFLNSRGKPIKAEYLRWMIKQRTSQAGIQKRITPHSFRRSFATLLHHQGAKLTTIQRLLGHVSITTTETYIQNDWATLYQDYSKLWKPQPAEPNILLEKLLAAERKNALLAAENQFLKSQLTPIKPAYALY